MVPEFFPMVFGSAPFRGNGEWKSLKLRGVLVAVGYCLVGENLEGRCSCVMERTHECARTRHWERRQTLRKCLIGGAYLGFEGYLSYGRICAIGGKISSAL